jgi:hypothetical protein
VNVAEPAREFPAASASAERARVRTWYFPVPLRLGAPKGYHPLAATRADTGEIVHARARKGSAGSSRVGVHGGSSVRSPVGSVLWRDREDILRAHSGSGPIRPGNA